EGDTSKAILRAVVQEEPRPAESIVSDVPRPLGGLLSALMAKDPNDRPASATAARVRIEELITELGGASPSSGGSSSSSRRTLAIVAVLLVVAVAATLPFILGGDDPQGSGLDLAEGSTPTTGAPERVEEALDPEQDPEARPATDSGEALAFDDTILEAAERDAEAAIEQARMLSDPTERMAALRAVAEQYLGTDAATRAASEALALESGEENADSSAEVAETEVATDAELLDALRATALDSDGEHLAPQAAFHAVSKVTPPIGYPDFPHFEELRLEVYGELEVTLRAIADSRLAAADGELEAGRLDAAQAGWSELLAWLEFLPPELAERLEETTDADGNLIEDAGAVTELPTDREGLLALIEQDQALDSAYVWRLTDRIELVSDRLEQLERAWRERFVIAMEQLDQARIADTLPGGDFERALARFDLEGAARAVEQLARELRSDRYRAGLGSLVDRLRGARSAFVWLADEWRADGWRRSTVPLPGTGRETGDARQLTAAGIVVETDEGNRDIAWSEFALDSAAIEGLFSNRMKRDYTSTERTQVADLIGFAAVNETFDRVVAVFDPSQRGRLSPQESNKLAASFERARAFAGEAASDALLDEVEAVRWLSTGLMAVDDRDWGTASYSFEVLLEDTATATATLLLSEGTPQGATVTWPPLLADPEPWTPPTDDGDVGETNDVEEEL
ncbi:MAG: serine/threonine-protein kinase, partial [Planctomycetota bacterium]